MDKTENFYCRPDLHDENYCWQSVHGDVLQTHGCSGTQAVAYGLLQFGTVTFKSYVPTPQHKVVLESLHHTLKT